jgi:hypothetical protein
MHGERIKTVINCCIWLVDSFEYVKMHRPKNTKIKNLDLATDF